MNGRLEFVKHRRQPHVYILILHEPVLESFLPHPNQRVCVCVSVSIVLETGVRKESPASSFPLVAWSDDDARPDGLEVQGIVGNDLLDLKKQ